MFVNRQDFRWRLREAQLRRNLFEKVEAYLAWLQPKTKISDAVSEAHKRGLRVNFTLQPKLKKSHA